METPLPCAIGDRIRLTKMEDDPCPIPVGAEGTVDRITPLWQGQTQIGVVWDSGRTLSLITPKDRFVVLKAVPKETPLG